MHMILPFTILCFSFLLSAVHAYPLVLRDVFDPQITSPNSSTTWGVGTTQTVTWITSNIPVNLTNPLGIVFLGQMANGSENLQINSPLAKGFNITDGQVQITVPNTPPGNNYIIVLMGDSGNASPQFVIAAANPGSPTPSPTATPSPTPNVPTSDAPGTTITSTSTAVAAASTPTSPTPSVASPSPTASTSIAAGSSTAPPSSTTVSSSTGTSAAASSTSTKNSAAWSSSPIDSWKVLNICVLSFFIVFLV